MSVSPSVWLDDALHRLLKATLQKEHLVAIRDAEILAIQRKHAPALEKEEKVIGTITPEIEAFCVANRAKLELDGSKCVQLGSGLVGFRAPANPALVPLDKRWTWEKIARSLKCRYKLRFFHAPKLPTIDKVKIKRELTLEELAKSGMALDTAENFFLELNRLDQADRQQAA